MSIEARRWHWVVDGFNNGIRKLILFGFLTMRIRTVEAPTRRPSPSLDYARNVRTNLRCTGWLTNGYLHKADQ